MYRWKLANINNVKLRLVYEQHCMLFIETQHVVHVRICMWTVEQTSSETLAVTCIP